MSKTDKTRPMRVVRTDSLCDRFKHVGNMMWHTDGTSEHYWKKLTSCHDSHCCGKDSPWRRKETRKRRYDWRRQLRRVGWE